MFSSLVRPSARSLAAALLVSASAFAVTACDERGPWWDWPEHGQPGTDHGRIKVTPFQQLPDVSADDYADNQHGLITGDTLRGWIADWKRARPQGVKGKLVILQVVPGGVTTAKYVLGNPAQNVVSYAVPAGSLVKSRDNGLSEFEAEIPDGAVADALLKQYGIDPRKDFIALTFEQQASTANSVVQSVGRAWLLLRYWGVAKTQLGILNGSINWNEQTHGLVLADVASAPQSVPPNDGTISVRDLRVDNTSLVITLSEIVDLLKGPASKRAGLRIVDARGGAEALGLRKATSTGRTDCASYDPTQPANRRCSTPFEGRLKGAKSVPWTQFLETAGKGFQFLPKAQVKALFDAQAGYDAAAKYTVQYCRTNQRSTVTGIAANVILGYPTRFYETSFIEWGHIAHGPTPNTQVVPEDFAWRTDLPGVTEHAELSSADLANYVPGLPLAAGVVPARWVDGPNYNLDADVSPITASWPPVDVTSSTTELSVDTDRAYLRGVTLEE